MITFVGGNPGRPYITEAMHNSVQMDHEPDTWNTSNVIRTWANNKLVADYEFTRRVHHSGGEDKRPPR